MKIFKKINIILFLLMGNISLSNCSKESGPKIFAGGISISVKGRTHSAYPLLYEDLEIRKQLKELDNIKEQIYKLKNMKPLEEVFDVLKREKKLEDKKKLNSKILVSIIKLLTEKFVNLHRPSVSRTKTDWLNKYNNLKKIISEYKKLAENTDLLKEDKAAIKSTADQFDSTLTKKIKEVS